MLQSSNTISDEGPPKPNCFQKITTRTWTIGTTATLVVIALLFIIIGACDVFTGAEVPDGSPAPRQSGGGDSIEPSSNTKTAGTDPVKKPVPDKSPAEGQSESALGDTDTSGGTDNEGSDVTDTDIDDGISRAPSDGGATGATFTADPEANASEGGRNLTRFSANIDEALFVGGADAVLDGHDADAKTIADFLSRRWRATMTRGDDAHIHDASDSSGSNAIVLALGDPDTDADGTDLGDSDDALFHTSDGGDTETAVPDDTVTKGPSGPASPTGTRLVLLAEANASAAAYSTELCDSYEDVIRREAYFAAFKTLKQVWRRLTQGADSEILRASNSGGVGDGSDVEELDVEELDVEELDCYTDIIRREAYTAAFEHLQAWDAQLPRTQEAVGVSLLAVLMVVIAVASTAALYI